VVVTDGLAHDREKLRYIAGSVSNTLTETFSDFAPVYVNFRSVSECERTKETEWAA
jgi:hypothetical protein